MKSMNYQIDNRSLFIGDNLDVLRKIDSECIDLIYIDPPFNSNKIYKSANKDDLYRSEFHDIWVDLNEFWLEEIKKKNSDLYSFLNFIDNNRNKAYITFIGIRLIEMQRVLKKTGSIYLHCDSNASHYIRIVMDCVFGRNNFINEIIWGYKWGGVGRRSFARKHDSILMYGKSNEYKFNANNVREEYTTKDKKWHNNPKGKILRDLWDDIPVINTMSKERTGYPTQKPEELLSRIIVASSDKGEVVMDAFCGSGTTLVACEKLKRNWIGIDSNSFVENIIKNRIQKEEIKVKII